MNRTRRRVITALLAAMLGTPGCMSEHEEADLAFRDALQEISGEMGGPPAGMRGRYGGVLDWVKRQAGNLANKAANFALCKVLKGNARELFYIAGVSRKNTLVGHTGLGGKEIAYDLSNYQAAAFSYSASGFARILSELRGGVYTGLLAGKHSGITDLIGPRTRAGINLPAPIPLVGRFLKGQVRYVRASTGQATMQGATIGLGAGLSMIRLGPMPLGLPVSIPVRVASGNWTIWDQQTAKIARSDANLGARLETLDQQCPSTAPTSYVSYQGTSHTERAKRLAKAMVRATKVDPLAWAMVPLVTALGIARDRGGVDYLCGNGPARRVPLPQTPQCPAHGAPRQPPQQPGATPTPPNPTPPTPNPPSSGGDHEDPTVEVTSPKNGATIDDVEIHVQASDNVGIDEVDLYVDAKWQGRLTGAPWVFTPRLARGPHRLMVRALDKAGNQATDAVTVQERPATGGNAGRGASARQGSGTGAATAALPPQRSQAGQPSQPPLGATIEGTGCSVAASGRLADGFPLGAVLLLAGLCWLRRRRRPAG